MGAALGLLFLITLEPKKTAPPNPAGHFLLIPFDPLPPPHYHSIKFGKKVQE